MQLIIMLGSGTEAARPLNILKNSQRGGGIWWEHSSFFEGLAIGAIKQSGPSPGVGNSFTNSVNDGPSPGAGH
ncbi:hypothetical protein LINGRAHAP2_LOCUS30617 [Linum grandiflorum]